MNYADNTCLFGDELSVEMIVWTGTLPKLSFLGEEVGLGDVRPYSELSAYIQEALFFPCGTGPMMGLDVHGAEPTCWGVRTAKGSGTPSDAL